MHATHCIVTITIFAVFTIAAKHGPTKRRPTKESCIFKIKLIQCVFLRYINHTHFLLTLGATCSLPQHIL